MHGKKKGISKDNGEDLSLFITAAAEIARSSLLC